MSFLLSPFLDVGVKLTLTAAGNIIYYTGSGIWWLGKRAIYGRQKTAEEITREERIQQIQQIKDLTEQVKALQDLVGSKERASIENN